MVVYVLQSSSIPKYYIGHTNNVMRRLQEHNTVERQGWASKYGSWKVVYTEEFPDRSSAVRKEKYLKSLKNSERLRQYIAGWRKSTS